jgi:cytochrome c nitrite reductase small subunit
MVALGLAIGASVGVGSYTFIYAEGYSYLLDAPSACANCHVMNEQYDGWLKSSHHAVATCNDCHTPAGALAKYTTKAVNGFWHSFAFTTGGFHEPIRITSRNRAITEGACAKCHEDVVRSLSATHPSTEAFSCIRCHASVGHLH